MEKFLLHAVLLSFCSSHCFQSFMCLSSESLFFFSCLLVEVKPLCVLCRYFGEGAGGWIRGRIREKKIILVFIA